MKRFLLAAAAALTISSLTSFGQEPPAAIFKVELSATDKDGKPIDLDKYRVPSPPPAAVMGDADPAAAVVDVRVAQYGGSGVCLATAGGKTLVATNAHIVDTAPGAAVSVCKDGRTYDSSQPIRCGDEDLVLLVVRGELPCLEMAEGDPKEGETVTLYGYPWDGNGKVVAKRGKVLAPDATAFRSTLAPVGGDSGGAVVDKDGKLVAINHGFSGSYERRGPQLGVRLKNLRASVRVRASRLFPRLGAKAVPKCDACGGNCPCPNGKCPEACPPKAAVPQAPAKPAAPRIEYRRVQYYDRRGNLVTQVIPVAVGGCPDGKCVPRAPACAGGNCPAPSFGPPRPFGK